MKQPASAPELAIDGGPPTFREPPPPRALLGGKERLAVLRLFDRAIASGSAIGYNGPEEERYCREFAEMMGGGYADAVNSGTNALYVALRVLDLPAYSEVIVPPVTDPGGVMPVPLCNCIPILADAAPGSFNTGADQIAARLSPRTSAIIVAHIAGEPADMAPIARLARSTKLPLIEDCAQSHGALYRGRPCGAFGTIAAFSTMFGKHHCTGGQGGVVFTKSRNLYWKARQCADRGKPFGISGQSRNVLASLNMNLNELSACIGRPQLRKLGTIVRRRRLIAQRICSGIGGLQAVHAPALPRGAEPSYWFLRLGLRAERLRADKERFCAALKAEGPISVIANYRHIPSEAPWFTERRVFGTPGLPWTSPQYRGDPDAVHEVPNAVAAVESCFAISIHEGMRARDADNIVKALAKVEAAYLRP